MQDPLIWQIALQIILIMCNAVFACAEIAVISMNDNKLAQMAAAGDKRAVRLARLTSQPARFLATIQVAITLSGFLGSAFAADNFSDILVNWLVSLGTPVPVATLDAISVVVITLILSYFTLVFGELVPKRLAMKKAEQLALGMATMLSVIARLAAPIVWVLTASTNCVLRLCGVDPGAEEEEVSEEEIRMMVDIGSQKGVIDRQEQEMIKNIFAFDDLPVGTLVTHRTELDLVWLDETPEEWEALIHETRHSLYPVCGEGADDIVGILRAKEYFRLSDKSRENVLKEAVHPAQFVPESLRADDLFRQMKESRDHLAVVLDEYGGVLGIVTMNDLLEQLVGEFANDAGSAAQAQEICELEPGCWLIQGNASLREVSARLNVSLPVDEYDTLGGFVIGGCGFIPEEGASLEMTAGPLLIRAGQVRGHRLVQAQVSLLPVATTAE